MSSKHLIDTAIVDFFNGDVPTLKIDAGNLKENRAAVIAMMSTLGGPPSSNVEVARRTIIGPSKTPKLTALVYTPKTALRPLPGILHIHGGGFIMGNAEMNKAYVQRLAEDTNCVVVSVDYRLAPETPFPGPLEDCYAALTWMRDSHRNLGIDAGRLAITGESGGGGLAASLAFLIRDRKEISVNLQFLTYPMLDDRTGSTTEPGPFYGEFVWTKADNAFAWSAYIDKAAGSTEVPYPAVPARIDNVSELPPAYIAVGSLDLFAPENIEYARRLMNQGVPCELRVFKGAIHAFDALLGTPLSDEFLADRKRVFDAAFAKNL
jgi:acetyl esterase/lipase